VEIVIGLLTVAATALIPIVVQRRDRPRRQLRYGVVAVPGVATGYVAHSPMVKLSIWSSSRADIPSALFDANRPIIFRFSAPVALSDSGQGPADVSSFAPTLVSPTELHVRPQILHQDFFVSFVLVPSAPFHLAVENSLIDVRVVRDIKVESLGESRQSRGVQRSQARARLSFLAISAWILGGSVALMILGFFVFLLDAAVGTGMATAGVIIFPFAFILFAVALIRHLMKRRQNERQQLTASHLIS
jgi:hypothetical protein